jgi:hypothetical protein
MRYHSSQRNIVWTVLFSILLVVTLNACGDANNVTGPPPPVPLSPDAKLSSLTVTSGSLQPVFSSDVANYSMEVATSVTSVTVTARPQNAGATVSINGQAATSRSVSIGAPGSSTPISIVVTAVSGSQNTYIVTVNRTAPGGNNNLQSLSVSPGPLAPTFTAGTTNYTVDVATSVTSVTVTARAQDAGASVSINGQPTTSQSVTVGAAGSNTPIQIVVTAPNGSQKPYRVTVNRAAPGGNNNLKSLSVSPGSLAPPFAASTTNYAINVADTVDSITVSAQPQDSGASVTITPGSQPVPLNAAGGPSTVISIDVTAPNQSQKTYTVVVNRAAPIPPPTITTSSLPNGNVGTPYSQQLTATGGSGALTWAIIAGSLPVGFNNISAGGVISGQPISAGAPATFTVQVTDARQQSDTQDLSIEIFNSP